MPTQDSKIEIVPYDPDWPGAFEAEAVRLRAALNACEYEDLQRTIAAQVVAADPDSQERYAAAKTDFIERVVSVAVSSGYPQGVSDQ